MAHLHGSSAGQAVVQFATSSIDPGQYALKFFVSRKDFAAEMAVYTDSPLGKLLPRLEGMYDNRDGGIADPHGHPLPPCIIIERGESLDEWSKRRKPDMWAAMPVRSLSLCHTLPRRLAVAYAPARCGTRSAASRCGTVPPAVTCCRPVCSQPLQHAHALPL
jgi:hypothetical protein